MNFPLSSFLFCVLTLPLLFPLHSAANPDVQKSDVQQPVYRIPLRIHLGNSDRATEDWLPILEEINFIWLSQAGICFEMNTVTNDEELETGLDLWFESTIPDWNGYFSDLHDMHVRDTPDLGPAKHPAKSPAARTAAHELGHALSLAHNQNSNDNLMRSKTYGWQLHADEITQARSAAGKLPASTAGIRPCVPPTIHSEP